MQLPDFCFGQRKITSRGIGVSGAGNKGWNITGEVLPKNICIWQFGIIPTQLDSYLSYCRIGWLAETPTSVADMDKAGIIFPNWDHNGYDPPRIYLAGAGTVPWMFNLRQGSNTGGRRMAIELNCASTLVAVVVFLVYSELPTNISGFLAHSFFTKVR